MKGKPDLCAGHEAPLAPEGTFDPEPVKRGEVRRSKMGRRRAIVLVLVHLAIFAHILHWILADETISPVEPSEAMFTVATGAVNAGTILLLASLLATLILGRWFCGWACHLVALQDLCAWMLKKIGIRPRPLRSRTLMWVPLLAGLHLFLWPAFSRWRLDIESPEYTNDLIRTSFWETFPGPFVAVLTFIVCGFIIVYLLGAKGFCTYACPYGGLFGVVDKLAPFRIRVTDACKGCGHCSAVCTSNVAVAKEVHEWGMVVDAGCMKCMDCVSVCPEGALYFGAGSPAIRAQPKVKHRKKTPAPFGLGEELAMVVAFSVSMVILRGLPTDLAPWAELLYGEMPQLFALGVSAIVAFIAVIGWRVVARSDVTFQKWTLKADGVLTKAGRVYTLFTALLLLFMIHSGVVQTFVWRGRIHWENTGPFSGAVWRQDAAAINALTADQKATIADGQRAFEIAGTLGLFPDIRVSQNLAWFALCRLDPEAASKHLVDATGIAPDRANLWFFLARTRVMEGRYEEAWLALAECGRRNTEHGRFTDPPTQLIQELAQTGLVESIWNLLSNAPNDLADDTALLLQRAEVALYLEKPDLAFADLARVLKNPPVPPIEFGTRLQRFATTDAARAIPVLQAGRDERPDDYSIRMVLAIAHAVAKDLASAESEARTMLARWKTGAPEGFPPGHPYLFLADIVQQRGNPQEAASLRAEGNRLNASAR